jgi:hypothetical protein
MSKKSQLHGVEQPPPFTPGIRAGEVRDYAFKMFRLKLEKGEPLTLNDWVNAEKDLLREHEAAEA